MLDNEIDQRAEELIKSSEWKAANESGDFYALRQMMLGLGWSESVCDTILIHKTGDRWRFSLIHSLFVVILWLLGFFGIVGPVLAIVFGYQENNQFIGFSPAFKTSFSVFLKMAPWIIPGWIIFDWVHRKRHERKFRKRRAND